MASWGPNGRAWSLPCRASGCFSSLAHGQRLGGVCLYLCVSSRLCLVPSNPRCHQPGFRRLPGGISAPPWRPNPTSAPATQAVPALEGLPGTQLTLATCSCSPPPASARVWCASEIQRGPRETYQRPEWAQKVQTLAFSRWGSRRIEK